VIAIVFSLFQSFFSAGQGSAGKSESDSIMAAVERAVDGIDPRLRALPGYRRILRRPVERALQYVAENLSTLPSAIPFERHRFSADPRLRALFVGPDHLLEILSASPELRGYLNKTVGPPPPELYVALRVERSERSILGMSVVNDQVMRDVPQTTVSFHNHRFAFPAATEPETRRQLQERAFDYLVEVIRHRLGAARMRREQLEQQQRRLLSGHFEPSSRGLDGWSGEASAVSASRHVESPFDRRRLLEIEEELDRLRADSGTLSAQLALAAQMLREPREHLRLDRLSMTLDHMNVKVSKHSRKSADTLVFNELLIGGDRRIMLEMIRFPSNELPEPADLVADAERVLHLIH
jgi:hypothetical protein